MTMVKRVLAGLVCSCLLLTCYDVGIYAVSASADKSSDNKVSAAGNTAVTDSYMKYYTANKDVEKSVTSVAAVYDPAASRDVTVGGSAGRTTAVRFNGTDSAAAYNVQVAKDGLYAVTLDYLMPKENTANAHFSLAVDGKIPNKSLQALELPRYFVDSDKIKRDSHGNDIRPSKTELFDWHTATLSDASATADGTLYIRLSAGTHELKLTAAVGGLTVDQLSVGSKQAAPEYAAYVKANSGKKNATPADFFYRREAEESVRTSDAVLYPTYDRSTIATQPNDPVKLRLNTIGQSNWKVPGQWIEWQVEVPADGWYTIGMRARQNELRGFFSSRSMTIDGQTYFSEMDDLRFRYDLNWYTTTLGNNDGAYRFYLTAGKHVVRMTASLGDVDDSISELQELTLELNTLYRSIIMITGLTVDSNRDYMLEDQIPDFTKTLESLRDRLEAQMNKLSSLGVRDGSDAVVISKLVYQLNSFIDKPDTVPSRINDFEDNISSMSSWALSMKDQPLELDYLFVKAEDVKQPKAGGGFFSQLGFRTQSLIGSFMEDYSDLSDKQSKTAKVSLNVWVALGRDQAEIIKNMTENYFIPQNDINVRISLVQQGLNEAIASGRGPDIALYTGDVVNLASRDALANFKTYKGFDKMTSRFAKNALTPYTYENGVYAIPMEETALMLFYRKDVFKELGLAAPKTWDDFYNAMTVLQNNKLTVGIPCGTSILGDISVLELLTYQRGGSLFNNDLSKVTLDASDSYSAFKQWTEFYTRYSLLKEFNFYNRFRSGEMAMGLQNSSMYATLKTAAPEIDDLWEMLPVPAYVASDGTRSTVTSGAVSPSVVLKNDHEQECFRYLDWLTSTESQTSYGLEVENILGQGARYNTANLEAVKKMNWTPAESNLLVSQLSQVQLTPNIPATYYVNRNITNAFRKVVVSGVTPRESLLVYSEIINREITRKNTELANRRKHSGQ